MELISIQPELVQVAPNLTLGVLSYETHVGKSDESLITRISEEVEKVRATVTLDTLTSQPQIKALREAYRSLGRDPGRYRGAAEALLRRVLSGKDFYEVNTVVDVNNLISIRSMAPVGSYDRDRFQGRVEFGVGTAEESYQAIGKGLFRLEGLPIFRDEKGPFGGPTSDSERTMVTNSTTHVVTIVMSFAADAELEDTLRFAANAFETYAAAPSVSFYAIDRTGVR